METDVRTSALATTQIKVNVVRCDVRHCAYKMAGSSVPTDAELESITPENLKSVVWKNFGFPSTNGEITSRETVICKLCCKSLKYHSTTSNMSAHLHSMHYSEYAERLATEEEPRLKRARITSFLPPSSSRCLPAAWQEAITKKVTEFICKDMRPVNILQGDGFKEFIREIEPRYTIPSRGTITNRIVKLYDTTNENIREMISGQSIALTTDGWTSVAMDSYVTVTAHFINEDWEMKGIVLQTTEF